MELITSYFPDLNADQKRRFALLGELYRDWNEKINVVSRKDIDALYVHHVLHSLAIAKVIDFLPGTHVMDVGTGGGFPGIPLAILFPEVKFYLIDSIAKKIKVVNGVASSLGLSNVIAEQKRVETVPESFDFIVSRAVTAFPDFLKLIKNKIRRGGENELPNGVLYLKGGDFEEEIKPYRSRVRIYSIRDFFAEDFFETKKIIYMQG
ncbi:16S rRNA (guanine(527)-N(7))-methyltransferase RsmG [Odoribacter lunatus]|uniref:16S rRNA (guanine(527)-N(7))-methyltransferase RsmG n=1 Tax=Odoribacter lunatus TaxID=2941335 RepID=UPI00204237BF|nr:16S rRNA (guanine(527)-N(7))-methyltransferase RsmG [Odoribacter lunatus]